jgi:ribonuclease VapC
MLVDASALVAIVLNESEGPTLVRRLESSSVRLTTSVAIFEAVLAIRRVLQTSVGNALHGLLLFIQRAQVTVVAIDEEAHLLALAAFERFGRGTGHPAQLNLGDCFAYAAAKKHGVKLLYKGDDFSRTDLG